MGDSIANPTSHNNKEQTYIGNTNGDGFLGNNFERLIDLSKSYYGGTATPEETKTYLHYIGVLAEGLIGTEETLKPAHILKSFEILKQLKPSLPVVAIYAAISINAKWVEFWPGFVTDAVSKLIEFYQDVGGLHQIKRLMKNKNPDNRQDGEIRDLLSKKEIREAIFSGVFNHSKDELFKEEINLLLRRNFEDLDPEEQFIVTKTQQVRALAVKSLDLMILMSESGIMHNYKVAPYHNRKDVAPVIDWSRLIGHLCSPYLS